MSTTLRILIGTALAGACVACATPPSPLVESVKAEYQDTAADPVVAKHASVELYETRKTVDRLERAWKQEREEEELAHLAELARRELEATRARGEAGALQAQLAELGETRDDLRLKARSLEATIARGRAAQAESSAESAQARAEMAAQIAQQRGDELADVSARARELEQEVSDLKTREDERGLVVTLEDVLFEFDSAELKAGATRTLERLAQFVNEYPEREILIEGHTDSVGSEDYNQRLSRERAEAVAALLAGRGVDRARIETAGLGESAPLASNDNEAGRQQNRRVDLILKNAAPRPDVAP